MGSAHHKRHVPGSSGFRDDEAGGTGRGRKSAAGPRRCRGIEDFGGCPSVAADM